MAFVGDVLIDTGTVVLQVVCFEGNAGFYETCVGDVLIDTGVVWVAGGVL